jgi:hypothetical protein
MLPEAIVWRELREGLISSEYEREHGTELIGSGHSLKEQGISPAFVAVATGAGEREFREKTGWLKLVQCQLFDRPLSFSRNCYQS